MKRISVGLYLVGALCAPAAFAQKWEIGGGAGGSFFTSAGVQNGAARGDAGLDRGINVGLWLGNNSGRLVGGEFRYDYENTNLKLTSSGVHVGFGAETHAVHYDFHFHFAPVAARVRPFVAAGAGVKLYRGTGTETVFQPLSNLALLTKTSEVKPLLSFGGGVKVALGHSLQLRFEARDVVTPFPKKVITPAQGTKLDAWIQDVAILVGLSATF